MILETIKDLLKNKRIEYSINKALNKKATNNLSTFTPKQIANCLYNHGISLSNKNINFLALNALFRPRRKEDERIICLVKTVFDNYNFINRFVNKPICLINEYQLRYFCSANKITYPEHVNWEDVMYRILLKYSMNKYTADTISFLNSKKEEYKMGSDYTEEVKTASAYATLNSDFNKPVTTRIVHTVNNKDIKSMSKQDLFNCAVILEQSIKKLKSLKAKSKAVAKEVKQQKQTLKVVIKYLDNKE